MYTPLSWYFVATAQASAEAFLDVVEDWLTGDRKAKYDFDFDDKHLKDITGTNEFFVGDNCSLEIFKTEDEDFCLTSILLERRVESENKLWVVECVYREPHDKSRRGSFVVNYRKRTLDPNVSAEFYETMRSIPRLPEFLIRAGLAMKEESDVFERMLVPESAEQREMLRRISLPYYPIVTLNVGAADVRNYVTPSCVDYFERCHSLFHMIVNRVDETENPEKWAIKVEYPRLRYVAKYYSYQNLPENAKAQRYANDEGEHGTVIVTALPHGFMNRPRSIVRDLFNLVNEGLSCFSRWDHKKVGKIFGRNKCAKRIPVTEAMGKAIAAARRAKGMTQSDLAKATAIEGGAENEMNGLLISRIEKARLKRIEITKLETLERCLGLPRGRLWDFSENNAAKGDAAEEAKSTKQETEKENRDAAQVATAETAEQVEMAVTAETVEMEYESLPKAPQQNETGFSGIAVRFCFHCGQELPNAEANFCPYCGTKKISL